MNEPSSRLHLPGPLVYTPPTPASTEDRTGGMDPNALIEVLAEFDPAAAVIALVGVRYYLTYTGGQVRRDLFANDPMLACCADAISLVEHRIDAEHIGHLHLDLLRAAADRSWPGVLPPSRTQLDVIVTQVLDEVETRAEHLVDELVTTFVDNPYYHLPFWALDVPEQRIDGYDRLELTWPEALTLERYGPPDTDTDWEALEADVLAARLAGGVRRGHLTLLP